MKNSATKQATKAVTPHELQAKLGDALSVSGLYLKREDMHPLGSHKGRSIPIMIDRGIADGFQMFAISSSGNAALAAAMYVRELNSQLKENETPIELDIFIGQKIATNKRAKLDELKDANIRISMQDRPLQALFAKTENKSVKGLRQSNDDTALVGYSTLADELLEIPDLRAVFIGTSSGTTAQALAEHFLKHSQKTHKKPVEVHIVQTTSCHPMSEVFNEDSVATGGESEVSIADAIVDHTALRKTKLVKIIEETGGSGWIATNESLDIAMKMVSKNTNLKISANSALAIVGLMNATYTGREWDGNVACIITGE